MRGLKCVYCPTEPAMSSDSKSIPDATEHSLRTAKFDEAIDGCNQIEDSGMRILSQLIHAHTHPSGLSPAEVALIPEAMHRSPQWMRERPMIERDFILKVEGMEPIPGTLRAYGEIQQPFTGDREQPEERGGPVIHTITLSMGGVEEDCTVCFDEKMLGELSELAREAE